jgi:putative membrane protein
MRNCTIALSLCALCAASLLAGPQAPQDQPNRPAATASAGAGQQAGQGSVAEGDAKFMKDAAADGLAEVELGKLAADKASSPDVKQFAKMMVDDHGKANDELKQLAARKNVALPSEPKPEHKAEKERLEKLSGAAFDEAYAKAMQKDHRKAVSAFSKQASSGKDPEVKQWAEGKVPTLKGHLEKADDLAGKSGGKGKDEPRQ